MLIYTLDYYWAESIIKEFEYENDIKLRKEEIRDMLIWLMEDRKFKCSRKTFESIVHDLILNCDN